MPGGAAGADHGPFLTQDGYGLPKNRWKHAQPCWPEKPQAPAGPESVLGAYVRAALAGFAADRHLARRQSLQRDQDFIRRMLARFSRPIRASAASTMAPEATRS